MANDRLSISIDAVDNASKALGNIGSAISGFGDIAKGVFVGGLMGKGFELIESGISSVKSAMIGGNAEFERYETQLGVLMGGADKAKERLGMLAEFGAKTPFELPELVRADKVLLSFGLHSADTAKRFGVSGEQILTTVGDIAAGTGVGFEELSLTFGKFASGATGEAIARFQELGIATREQMTSWGLEFSKSGQLLTPVDKAFTILEANVRKKFGGMMDAQSQTFEGMVSNMQDWLGQAGRIMGKPIFDALKANLGELLKFLNSDTAKNALTGIANGIASSITNVIGFLQSMKPVFDQTAGFIQGFVFALTGVSQAIEPFSDTLGELASSAGFGTLGYDIAFITEAIGLFIQSVILGGGNLSDFAQTVENLGYTASNLGNVIAATFFFFDTAIKQAFSGENLDAASVFLYALEDMGIQVPMFIEEIAFGITDGLGQIPDAINKTVDTFYTIALAITAFGVSIVPVLEGILASVLSIFGTLIPIAIASSIGAWTMISTTIQTVVTSAIAILQTWLPVVQGVLTNIAAFLAIHGSEIQLLVSTAWTAITTIIQIAIDTVTVIINALAPVVTEIFGAISTFLNAHGSEILTFLTTSWNKISAIVTTAAGLVQSIVTTVFGAIATFVRNHGDTIQTVLTTAWNVIKTIIGGAIDIISGIINLATALWNRDWETAWSSIESITQASNSIIQSLIDTAMLLIGGLITTAVNNFKLGWESGWQLMQTATSTAMTLIKDAINTGIETAKTVIANGVEAFIAKFNGLKDKMSVIGQQLLEGMVQGIRDKVGWLVTEGQRAANAVLDAIKNTLGVNSPAKEAVPYGEAIPEGMALGINNESGLSENAGADMATRTIARVRTALEPLPKVVAPIMTQTASTMVNAWSGLNDDLEDQILGAAESIVELAESGDSASLVFAQSFEVLRQTITGIVPSFDDSKSAITRMHETLAAGKFDVQAYWKIYEEMMHGIGRTTSETMPVVAQTTTTTFETMQTAASVMQTGVTDAFQNILVLGGVAINTLTGEVVNSSNTMQSAIGALENRASASANAIAASMIAAGQVINTTQTQLANFIQSGGIGGITGGTYTPSPAFQESFRNQVVAPPRPSSVPKPEVTNNTNVTMNVNVPAGSDQAVFENAFGNAIRRAGLTGGYF